MDEIKYSVGPFEIFSGFISGLPFLFLCYIFGREQFDVVAFGQNVLLHSTFSDILLLVVTSYLIGTVMAPISYNYFKYAGSKLGKDYLHMEKVLLGNWNGVYKELTKDDIRKLTFEERLTYFIKRRYGKISKISHINDYLVAYLRQRAPSNAVKADGFIAMNIMLRNLSLGFLLIALYFVFLVFRDYQNWELYFFFFCLCIFISVCTLLQAYIFKNWWTREAMLGFYNQEIQQMSLF